MSSHNDLGHLGEQMAKGYLQKKGYTILNSNWRYKKAEVDLIVQKSSSTIVIVEVKTRSNTYAGKPEEFVSASKIKLLIMAANEYVSQNELDVEVRFDIVSIVKNNKYEIINHIENAFYHF